MFVPLRKMTTVMVDVLSGYCRVIFITTLSFVQESKNVGLVLQ